MPTDIPMLDVLLKRMETHPEEFVDGNESRKWGNILETYYDCLTQGEKDKIAQGTRNARRLMLNQRIMQRLAGEEEPSLLPMEQSTLTFNTSSRSVWGETTLAKLQKALEEREIESMHDYYKKTGQAE